MATEVAQSTAELHACDDTPVQSEDRLSPSESPEPTEDAGKDAEVGVTNGAPSKGEAEGKGAVTKTKKKEDKSIEYILRALSSLSTPEEKLAALCKKYADLHEEHRVLQSSFKQQQRRMTVVQREKDQLQAEHTKAVIAKSKLESLCRELQKQNKVVKEESLLRAKEEEEKRKEISGKFQKTIEEIQKQMTENHEKNVKLREENLDMAGKLKKFLEQYEVREQQIEKMTKHRELENQLYEAKLAQAAAILKEEQERNIREKELLLLQAHEGEKKNTMLEAQLEMYKERYEDFQATINRSNDMFQKLKNEMDKMGKRIKKLEKEGAQWKAKWETSNRALLEMAEDKQRTDKDKQTQLIKIGKLESLCRALQAELHGKKGASPQPSIPSIDVSDSVYAVGPIPAIVKEEADTTSTTTNTITTGSTHLINSTPASATATPPNTPEDTGSRASPSPDSNPTLPDSLPTVPTGQNGPIAPPPDSEASPAGEEEGKGCPAEVSAVSSESQVSSSSDVVGDCALQASASASDASGQDQSPSVSSSTEAFTTASEHSNA